MIGRLLVLRLDKNEDLIEGIKKACKEVGIKRGFVKGLGSLSSVKVAFEKVKGEKEVTEVKAEGDKLLNVVYLFGIVAEKNGELDLHLHGAILTPDGKYIGGHILGGVVDPTFEIIVTEIQKARMWRMVREGVEVLEVSE